MGDSTLRGVPTFLFGMTSFSGTSRGYQTEVYRMGNNIIRYMASMALANRMLESATITLKEFLAFEDKMRQKYGLPECSLYRDFHLLYPSKQR